MHARFVLLALPALLAGCDLLGIETASQIEARKEAEGRAIGSACRHAVRSIEDCYAQNPKAAKAAVFAGWREMDQYMRENDVAGMPYADKKLPMITEKADEVAEGKVKGAEPAPGAATPTAARPPGAASAAAAGTTASPTTRSLPALPGTTPPRVVGGSAAGAPSAGGSTGGSTGTAARPATAPSPAAPAAPARPASPQRSG